MATARYILMRTIQSVVLLFLVMTFLFFFMRLLPGSYLNLMLDAGASPETVEYFEDKWGLNDPLYVQYFRYMANLLTGDAGESMAYGVPVTEFVKMRIFNSLILVGPGITIGYLLGSIIGGLMGSNRGSKLEKYGTLPLILAGSFPSFFTAIVFIIVIAGWFDLVPTSGMFGFENPYRAGDFAWWRPYLTMDFAKHYVLPFSVILIRYMYLPTLIMRTSVVEVLGQDFFFYHRMTGLPGGERLRRMLNHAMLPVITMYPISMTRAVGGMVVIEMVFNWPGMGFALLEAVFSRDIPVVQFVFFLIAAFIVFANFAVDIFYSYVDPRVRVGED